MIICVDMDSLSISLYVFVDCYFYFAVEDQVGFSNSSTPFSPFGDVPVIMRVAVRYYRLISFCLAQTTTGPISHGRTVTRMISRERGRLSYPASVFVTVFAKDIEGDAQLWEAEVDVQFEQIDQHFGTLCLFPFFSLSLSLLPQIQGKRGLILSRDVDEMSILCKTSHLVYAQQVNLVYYNVYIASFPGLPRFSRSSTSVYYTERKPKNEKGGGLGTRLMYIYIGGHFYLNSSVVALALSGIIIDVQLLSCHWCAMHPLATASDLRTLHM